MTREYDRSASAAFAIGGFSAAATIAAALMAGARRCLQGNAQVKAQWTVDQWSQALALSELLRRRDHQRAAAERKGFERTARAQQLRIDHLEADLAIIKAQAVLGR
jgi:hypothetical protein